VKERHSSVLYKFCFCISSSIFAAAGDWGEGDSEGERDGEGEGEGGNTTGGIVGWGISVISGEGQGDISIDVETGLLLITLLFLLFLDLRGVVEGERGETACWNDGANAEAGVEGLLVIGEIGTFGMETIWSCFNVDCCPPERGSCCSSS